MVYPKKPIRPTIGDDREVSKELSKRNRELLRSLDAQRNETSLAFESFDSNVIDGFIRCDEMPDETVNQNN